MTMLEEWQKDLEKILSNVCANQCGTGCGSGCTPKVDVSYPWELLTEVLEKQFHLSHEYIKGRFEGGIVIDVGSLIHIGKDSTFKGPSYIEGQVYIGENTIIKPQTTLIGPIIIGDNCVVGGEVKNSIILHGSKLAHHGYVGDSVIGRNCLLGAGVVLTNQRFDKNNVFAKVSKKEKRDSGRLKLGAIIEDGCYVGSNATLYPGACLSSGAVIFPGETVKGYRNKFK